MGVCVTCLPNVLFIFWQKTLSFHILFLCELLGGFVTIMGQDGNPIQISASDLQSGATLTGTFLFFLYYLMISKSPGIVKRLKWIQILKPSKETRPTNFY